MQNLTDLSFADLDALRRYCESRTTQPNSVPGIEQYLTQIVDAFEDKFRNSVTVPAASVLPAHNSPEVDKILTEFAHQQQHRAFAYVQQSIRHIKEEFEDTTTTRLDQDKPRLEGIIFGLEHAERSLTGEVRWGHITEIGLLPIIPK